MSPLKCERCGKFRSSVDVLYIASGDTYDYGEVLECRWCMAPVDREQMERQPAPQAQGPDRV